MLARSDTPRLLKDYIGYERTKETNHNGIPKLQITNKGKNSLSKFCQAQSSSSPALDQQILPKNEFWKLYFLWFFSNDVRSFSEGRERMPLPEQCQEFTAIYFTIFTIFTSDCEIIVSTGDLNFGLMYLMSQLSYLGYC